MSDPRKEPPPAVQDYAGKRYYLNADGVYRIGKGFSVSPGSIAPARSKHAAKLEADLQRQCEGLLQRRGYRSPSADTLSETPGQVTGWYLHIPAKKARGMFMLPDLLIIDQWWKRTLGVELKTRDEYQPGQREAIEASYWKLARDYDEFRALLDAWSFANASGQPRLAQGDKP
jgi:hypothetical protein